MSITRILATLIITIASFALGTANAYVIKTKFETKNYAVYEVTLGKGEYYGTALKKIIAKDVASRGKFQTTTAVYPMNSKGMSGNIKEELNGIITTENYSRSADVTVNFNDLAKYSSYVGIYLSFKQFKKIADNRTVNSLAAELAQMPLILEDVPVDISGKDFKGKLYYTTASGALIIDFQVIDSIFYDKKKLESVDSKCKVNILAIADRYTDSTPFFIAAHGAVNDIMCEK